MCSLPPGGPHHRRMDALLTFPAGLVAGAPARRCSQAWGRRTSSVAVWVPPTAPALGDDARTESSVGRLLYGDGSMPILIEDRALAHLKVVISTKLRRGESFTVSWRHLEDQPRGRSTIWVHPSIPIRFEFDSAGPDGPMTDLRNLARTDERVDVVLRRLRRRPQHRRVDVAVVPITALHDERVDHHPGRHTGRGDRDVQVAVIACGAGHVRVPCGIGVRGA